MKCTPKVRLKNLILGGAFCFQLTSKEYETLKSQIATSNIRGGKQKLPYVFTEKGILMLSGLLKNEVAIEVSVKIVEAFVEMRKF